VSNIVHKSWGYEEIIHNDKYCAKLLVYTKGGIASSLHFHEKKQETFIVTSGKFDIEVNGQMKRGCEAGEHITLTPGMQHRIRCIKPGVIVECSTHDDPADCVRLIPSES
jgi:quercetin dioxygenase-like cupin family protein